MCFSQCALQNICRQLISTSERRANKNTHRPSLAAPCLSCLHHGGIWVTRNKQGLCVCYFLFVPPSGHILHALRRGTKRGGAAGGGGEGGLDGGQGEHESPVLVRRPQVSHSHQPQAVASQAQRSPGLLHRILSKCRKRSEYQGATNGAFEGD